jgi:hypothetical protein
MIDITVICLINTWCRKGVDNVNTLLASFWIMILDAWSAFSFDVMSLHSLQSLGGLGK